LWFKKNLDERREKVMAKEKELVHQTNVKFSTTNYERVKKVSHDLGLNVSEIIRRSTLVGLKKLERARIPGSPEPRAVDME
jgi:ribosomal protein L4